jgi:hypothetical protein
MSHHLLLKVRFVFVAICNHMATVKTVVPSCPKSMFLFVIRTDPDSVSYLGLGPDFYHIFIGLSMHSPEPFKVTASENHTARALMTGIPCPERLAH